MTDHEYRLAMQAGEDWVPPATTAGQRRAAWLADCEAREAAVDAVTGATTADQGESVPPGTCDRIAAWAVFALADLEHLTTDQFSMGCDRLVRRRLALIIAELGIASDEICREYDVRNNVR